MLALSTRRSLLVGRGLLGASQSQRRLSGEPVSGNGVIGLRREEKGRWERRAAISPSNVATLTAEGTTVLVQPSNLRAFNDAEYRKAGAIISEDLSSASVIIGVKEVPISQMIADRTYMYFSHTIKAQPYNMDALDAVLQKNIRLLDYEKMLDENGARVIAFGDFAGKAGMMNGLVGLGMGMLARGYNTPFVNLSFARSYPSTKEAKEAIFRVGQAIQEHGLPPAFPPVVCVFTGNGNVSKGAQEMFRQLPHEFIPVSQLKKAFRSNERNKVFACVVEASDFVVRTDSPGAPFDFDHYIANGSLYTSEFHSKIAPYASLILNGIYWDARFPRLLTKQQLKDTTRSPLISLSDVSADPNGSIELVTRCTKIEDPFLLWDAQKMEETQSDEGGNVVYVSSVDNLPAEFPREASEYFGLKLTSYLSQLARNTETAQLTGPLRTAVIADQGRLTPDFEYIAELRKQHTPAAVPKVLLLGSGMVARPLVEYLCNANHSVTVASPDSPACASLCEGRPLATPLTLNVGSEKDRLRKLIQEHDIVVSFVPAPLHPVVARECIDLKTNMVTASYISDEMKALHSDAVSAGVTIMNEIGLDPGLDHLSAMKMIHEASAKGGKITSFRSYCGGLPAPESSNENPLRYKFSWSPMGVLRAGGNNATYLEDSVVKSVSGEKLFESAVPEEIAGMELERLPNRDSLMYRELYGLPDSQTVLRGTLRFRGFSRVMNGLRLLNLLSSNEYTAPKNMRELMSAALTDGDSVSLDADSLCSTVHSRLTSNGICDADVSAVSSACEWLGLFDESQPISDSEHAPINLLCRVMTDKMSLAPHERDMVVMHHSMDVKYATHTERTLATMVEYGVPSGDTAMARTVALPAAIMTRLILNGKIDRRGVLAPLTPAEYEPTLAELESHGIRLEETTFEVK